MLIYSICGIGQAPIVSRCVELPCFDIGYRHVVNKHESVSLSVFVSLFLRDMNEEITSGGRFDDVNRNKLAGVA